MQSSVNTHFKWAIKAVFFITLCLVQTRIFYKNKPAFVNNKFFSTFQKDSEILVIGKMLFDKADPNNKEKVNLGFVIANNSPYSNIRRTDGFNLLKSFNKTMNYYPYKSQFGLHGIVYSFLYNKTKLNTLNKLNLLCAFLTSVSLLLITYGFSKIIGKGFAIAFLLSVSTSPWVISFARNLYWSPFLWFMPTVFSMFFYFYSHHRLRYLFLSLFFISIFIKSLCGYEYLSTIILFACAIFIIPVFEKNYKLSWKSSIKYTALFSGSGIAAFFCAILVHANIRSNTILKGIESIWKEDVKRRTYGQPSLFHEPQYTISLAASPQEVLKQYIMHWQTDILYKVPGDMFIGLILSSLIVIGYQLQSRHLNRWFNCSLFFTFAAAPISWFILAKAHSYVHIHMNYVLWYFGFVATLISINIEGIKIIFLKILNVFS